MPISMGVLNYSSTLAEIELDKHFADPMRYDQELKQKYCKCDECDPKYYPDQIFLTVLLKYWSQRVAG